MLVAVIVLVGAPLTRVQFKAYTTGMASGHVEYHVISKNHWSIPETVNRTTMQQGMRDMTNAGIIYGGSESYRHMCRFNSGFFYEEEPMKKYEWYWRVEPSIEFWCDLTYGMRVLSRTVGDSFFC